MAQLVIEFVSAILKEKTPCLRLLRVLLDAHSKASQLKYFNIGVRNYLFSKTALPSEGAISHNDLIINSSPLLVTK